MAKWKFRVSVIDYGVIEVDADTREEAMDKAHELKGEYHYCETEVTDVQPF